MKLSEFKTTGAYVAPEVLEKVRKCTTAEEVEKLAREYDVELTADEISEILKHNSLKELTDEQLDLVAGGDDWGDKKGKHLPANHGRHIGKYEAQGHIGERVYCVKDVNTTEFGWGILMRSYEARYDNYSTVRVHEIRFEGCNHDGDQLCVRRDDYGKTEYIYKNIPVGQVMRDILGDECTLFLYNK